MLQHLLSIIFSNLNEFKKHYVDEKKKMKEDSFMIMNDGKAIFRYISFSLCWKQQSRKALNRLETDFSNKKKSKQV